jgi:two-component system OmpR family sensor kinase
MKFPHAARSDPDQALLSRARRVIALHTAAAITVSLLVLGVLALVVVIHSQNAAAASLLR